MPVTGAFSTHQQIKHSQHYGAATEAVQAAKRQLIAYQPLPFLVAEAHAPGPRAGAVPLVCVLACLYCIAHCRMSMLYLQSQVINCLVDGVINRLEVKSAEHASHCLQVSARQSSARYSLLREMATCLRCRHI